MKLRALVPSWQITTYKSKSLPNVIKVGFLPINDQNEPQGRKSKWPALSINIISVLNFLSAEVLASKAYRPSINLEIMAFLSSAFFP